jgi:hypothetical protein
MRALDFEKLGKKAYFNEMIWVTEKLGLHPLMEHAKTTMSNSFNNSSSPSTLATQMMVISIG